MFWNGITKIEVLINNKNYDIIGYIKLTNFMKDWSIIILAAGKGTRLKSQEPKPLVKIEGEPLISNILNLSNILNIKEKYVIISEYTNKIKNFYPNYQYINTIPKETADGDMACINKVKTRNVLIAQADDSFFYNKETLLRMIDIHEKYQGDFTVGLADIVKKLEYKSAVFNVNTHKLLGLNQENSSIPGEKVVCGLYAGKTEWIQSIFPLIEPNPKNGEYGIPSGFLLGIEKGDNILYCDIMEKEWFGINNLNELENAKIKFNRNKK